MVSGLRKGLFSKITNLMIIVPLVFLFYHYSQEKYQVYQCEKKNGSYDFRKNTCDFEEKHLSQAFLERNWRQALVCEILLIGGLYLKLIFARRYKK